MERRIIIKKLRLLNFKGIRDFTVEFNDRQTSILGCNGSGKTTIFDAFTWMLFGKDSLDRKAFSVKTRDASGKTIEKLPHEVSAVMRVNNEEITLCRRFNEKWTKKRGSAVEEFTGNTEERLYNDVPCSLREWQEKIASICSEDIFKFITNPLYFSAQKADVQRAMLYRMAGGVSDDEIAAGNADFQRLLGSLTGKSLDELKREIASKKRRLKAEIEVIPERIDERKRDMPEPEDWEALTRELEDKNAKLAEIEGNLSDAFKALSAANEKKVETLREIGRLKMERTQREMAIRQEVQNGYDDQMRMKRQIEGEIKDLRREMQYSATRMSKLRDEMEACSTYRDRLIAEWRSINAQKLAFNDDDFICPTCKRPLDVEDIEAKQQEMTETFNAQKSKKLEDNVTKGKANTGRMKEIEDEIAKAQSDIDGYKRAIGLKETDEAYKANPICPDAMPEVIKDGRYNELTKRIDDLSAGTDNDVENPDITEMKEARQVMVEAVDELKKRLSKKEIIERNNARIAELEKQQRTQSEELAKLEGNEFTIDAFSKAKAEAVEKKINGMFSIVKFNMFDRQINGGEVETCKATVNGQPYDDGLNAAGRINAGIDIINAISKSEGIYAPIVIDNAESYNSLIPTQSQLIRLVVTTDPKLIVKNDGQINLFNN